MSEHNYTPADFVVVAGFGCFTRLKTGSIWTFEMLARELSREEMLQVELISVLQNAHRGGRVAINPNQICPRSLPALRRLPREASRAVSFGKPANRYISEGVIDIVVIGNALEVARAHALPGREFVAVTDAMS